MEEKAEGHGAFTVRKQTTGGRDCRLKKLQRGGERVCPTLRGDLARVLRQNAQTPGYSVPRCRILLISQPSQCTRLPQCFQGHICSLDLHCPQLSKWLQTPEGPIVSKRPYRATNASWTPSEPRSPGLPMSLRCTVVSRFWVTKSLRGHKSPSRPQARSGESAPSTPRSKGVSWKHLPECASIRPSSNLWSWRKGFT